MDVTLREWRPVPSLQVRRAKTEVEDELLFKRGAKADWANRRGPRHTDLSCPPIRLVKPVVLWRDQWIDEKYRFKEQREQKLDTVFNTWRVIRPVSERNLRLHKRKQRPSTIARPVGMCEDITWFSGSYSNLLPDVDHVTTIKELKQTTAWWKSAQKYNPSNENTQNRYEVLIHVCSTPDMAEEREFMAEVTYPEIERVCQNIGLAVHIKDFRLGFDRLADDFSASVLCLSDLDKCINCSVATSFLAIIGNQLDSAKVPNVIESRVFEKLRMVVLREMPDSLDLVDDVYRLDNNAIPPAYFFKLDELGEGSETINQLANVLKEAAKRGIMNGLLEYETVRRLNLSLTHLEVEKGLLQSSAPEMTACCLIAPETDIPDTDCDNETSTDLSIQQLRSDVITFINRQASENISSLKHKTESEDYFKHLHATAKNLILQQIADCVKVYKINIRKHLIVETERSNHCDMTRKLVTNFGGPEDMLKPLMLLLEPRKHKGICLYGKRGCGKTALMAKLATVLPKWYTSTRVVLRFVGLTIESLDISDVLRSVCIELCNVCNIDGKHAEVVKDYINTHQFGEALEAVSSKMGEEEMIWIFLDGIDNATHGKPLFELLPDSMPLNMAVMVSCRKDTYEKLFRNDTRHFSAYDCTSLLEPYMNDIAVTLIGRQNRLLTEDQIQALVDKMTEERSPLLLNLVMHNAYTWPSTYLPDKDYLSRTIDNVIDHILLVTERRHGIALVKYVLCYIVTAKYGLTEKELTEIVSKNETFLYEQGSLTDGMLLYLSVTRVLSEFSTLMARSKCDAECTLVMLSRDLAEHVVKRYTSEVFNVELHYDLSEYFIQQIRELTSTERCTEEKWLMLLGSRRISAVFYHLTKANVVFNPTVDKIKSQCLFNFNWLIARVIASSLQCLAADLETVAHINDATLLYYYQCIKQCHNVDTDSSFLVLAVIFDHMSQFHEKSSYAIHTAGQFKHWLTTGNFSQIRPRLHVNSVFGRIERTISGIHDIVHVDETKNRLLFIDGIHRLGWLDIQNGEKYHITYCDTHSEPIITSYGQNEILYIHTCDRLLTFNPLNAIVTVIAVFPKQIPKMMCICGQVCALMHENSVILTELSSGYVTLIPELDGSHSIATLKGDPNILVAVTDVFVQFYDVEIHCVIKTIPLSPEGILLSSALHLTKDCRFVVVVYESKMTLIDAERLCFYDEYPCQMGTLVNCTLNMCNEHAFLADDSGCISVVQLRTCSVLFVINTNSPQERRVVCQTFSEDDHFLIVGFSNGQIAIYNVPARVFVIAIQSHTSPVNELKFIRSRPSFECLITKSDADSDIRCYDLQGLLLQARKKLIHSIIDKDLLNEEKAKLNVAKYFDIFEPRKSNRIFLNGADVSAFYKPLSPNHFAALNGFGFTIPSELHWMSSKRLNDLRKFAIHCIHPYKNIIVTRIQHILATWDTEKGSLLNRVTCLLSSESEKATMLKFSQRAHYIMMTGEDANSLKSFQVWHVDTQSLTKSFTGQTIMTVSRNGNHMLCCDTKMTNEGKERYWVTLWNNTTQEQVLRCAISHDIDLATCSHSLITDDGRLWTVILTHNGNSRIFVTDTSFTLQQRLPVPSKYLSFINVDFYGIVGRALIIGNSMKLLLSVSDSLLAIVDLLNARVTHISDTNGVFTPVLSEKKHEGSTNKSLVFKKLDKDPREIEHTTVSIRSEIETLISLSGGESVELLVDNPDGDVMLAAMNNLVRVWSRSRLKLIGTIAIPCTTCLTTATVRADDAYISTGTDSGMLQVWETRTCRLVACHPTVDTITSIQYLPNGDILAVVGSRCKRTLIFTVNNV